MRQHTTSKKEKRKKKKKKKTRELDGPSQKDNKNRKKQVLFILEGNAQKSLQAKGKNRGHKLDLQDSEEIAEI
jgi:DNA gyrase/topoisomerase IV subunit B